MFGPLPKKRAVFEPLTRGLGVKFPSNKTYFYMKKVEIARNPMV